MMPLVRLSSSILGSLGKRSCGPLPLWGQLDPQHRFRLGGWGHGDCEDLVVVKGYSLGRNIFRNVGRCFDCTNFLMVCRP